MNNEKGYESMLAALLSTDADTGPSSTYLPELTRAWPVSDLAAFRAELRQWLHESWDTSITVREWWSRLADAGLTMPTWPRTAGGISAPTAIQQLVERELAAAGAIGPPVRGIGLRLVGAAVRQHGTPEQLDRFLRPLMRGEHTWAVLVQEHDADLADIETTATEEGSSFSITGGKLWTPEAPVAEWGLVLARTDRKAHVKRAMTCFAVDMSADGVGMTASDARPHLVTFDHVTSRRADAIGGVGGGWAVAHSVVAHAQTSLAGRIRRGVVSVEPGWAAGNLDRTVAEVLAEHQPRAKRRQRRDEPGSERRQSPDFT